MLPSTHHKNHLKNYNKLLQAFENFDVENPKIWELLVKFSFEAKNSGMTNIGISLLVERIRWEIQVVTKSSDKYKINNNHRAFYARKLMATYPELTGLFRTRAQL
jgi:hypothetical protein